MSCKASQEKLNEASDKVADLGWFAKRYFVNLKEF